MTLQGVTLTQCNGAIDRLVVTEWVNRDVCGPGPLFQCRLRGLLLLPLLLLRGPRGRHRPTRVEAAVRELLLVGRLQQGNRCLVEKDLSFKVLTDL